jgi:hypothetical protein
MIAIKMNEMMVAMTRNAMQIPFQFLSSSSATRSCVAKVQIQTRRDKINDIESKCQVFGMKSFPFKGDSHCLFVSEYISISQGNMQFWMLPPIPPGHYSNFFFPLKGIPYYCDLHPGMQSVHQPWLFPHVIAYEANVYTCLTEHVLQQDCIWRNIKSISFWGRINGFREASALSREKGWEQISDTFNGRAKRTFAFGLMHHRLERSLSCNASTDSIVSLCLTDFSCCSGEHSLSDCISLSLAQ